LKTGDKQLMENRKKPVPTNDIVFVTYSIILQMQNQMWWERYGKQAFENKNNKSWCRKVY